MKDFLHFELLNVTEILELIRLHFNINDYIQITSTTNYSFKPDREISVDHL